MLIASQKLKLIDDCQVTSETFSKFKMKFYFLDSSAKNIFYVGGWQHSILLLVSVMLGITETISTAKAQIFLSPQTPSANQSSATIDIDNTRCSSSGGSVPSLSLSVGADPYAVNYFNDFNAETSSNNSSPFLGIVSLNIPLRNTNQNFNCNELHDLAVRKSKLNSLREMVDEQIITEDQYSKAVQNLYKNIIFNSSTSENLIEQAANELKAEREGGVIVGK
ncbi:MAG: hypothetical protein CMN98_01270 [Synechococcus sp. NP17]|mgnify:CR=1 FL=1|nr:hypothetical protein [Synechococcus sp. NP17]